MTWGTTGSLSGSSGRSGDGNETVVVFNGAVDAVAMGEESVETLYEGRVTVEE